MVTDWQGDDDAAEHFDDRVILRDRGDRVILLRVVCRVLVAIQIAALVWFALDSVLVQPSEAFVRKSVADFVVVGGFIVAAPFSVVGYAVVAGPAWAGMYEWGSVPYGLILGIVTVLNWLVFATLVRFATRRAS